MCISKQFLFFGLLIPGILFPIWTHGQQKVTNERIWDTLGNMTQHYDARVIQFSKEPVVLHRTIFLGNSITEMDRVPTENKGLVRTTRLTLTATYRYFKLKSRVFKLEHSKKLVVIVKVTKILVV